MRMFEAYRDLQSVINRTIVRFWIAGIVVFALLVVLLYLCGYANGMARDFSARWERDPTEAIVSVCISLGIGAFAFATAFGLLVGSTVGIVLHLLYDDLSIQAKIVESVLCVIVAVAVLCIIGVLIGWAGPQFWSWVVSPR